VITFANTIEKIRFCERNWNRPTPLTDNNMWLMMRMSRMLHYDFTRDPFAALYKPQILTRNVVLWL